MISSSSSIIATGGLLSSNSASSSSTVITSICGLPADEEEDGVCKGVSIDFIIEVDSSFLCLLRSWPAEVIVEGDSGDLLTKVSGSAIARCLRLIVTLLDVASVGISGRSCGGVCGGIFSTLSFAMVDSDVVEPCETGVVALMPSSTDLLREALLETLWRFREEGSSPSKGFGLVEQGSEDVPRSRDSSAASRSIW